LGHVLEFDRAAIAERGVAAAGVVEGLDVAEDSEARLVATRPAAAFDQFLIVEMTLSQAALS
jgi:hypothetical protein